MKLSIACPAAATLAALLALAPAPSAQNHPPPFPRDGVVKVAENDRVIVWGCPLEEGRTTPMHAHTLDVVAVFLDGVTTKTTAVDGTTRMGNPMRKGDAVFQPRGVIHTEEATTDGGRVIGVELKDAPAPPPICKPPQSPARISAGRRRSSPRQRLCCGLGLHVDFRAGRSRCISTTRTRSSFFIADGKIQSTDAEGQTTVTERKFGDVSLNARNRAHTEETIAGSPRAIVVELK